MRNALVYAGAAIALACAPAMAQAPLGGDPAAGAGIGGAAVVGGAITAENPFTVANIDPAQPFGVVDVTMAGANAESMQAWANSLDAGLKTEISQRCDVISNNSSSFPGDAVGFCTTWSTVQANEVSPLPVTSPNILPAPLPATPNAGTPPPAPAIPGAM